MPQRQATPRPAAPRKTQLDTKELAPWAKPGEVPCEFALFYFGANESTKGVVWLDETHAQRAFATWQDYGNQLMGDYNHGAAKESVEPVPASCCFDLAVRPDGLYAVNVEWTTRAKGLLLAREYRYYSPYFYEVFDGTKWWVTEIINVALTNQPATKRQRPLVWSRRETLTRRRCLMLDQATIDTLKKILAKNGTPEDKISDTILEMGPAIEAAMNKEPIKPAEPTPEPAAGDTVNAEEPMQYSKDPVVAALQKQQEESNRKLALLEKSQGERAKKDRDALYAEFDRKGKLRNADPKEARELLDKHGEQAFKAAYGRNPELTDQRPPAAPAALGTAPVPLIPSEPVKFGTRTLSAAVVGDDEVKAYQAKNPKASYTDAMLAVSAEKKVASTR